jgi:hypothetical protein
MLLTVDGKFGSCCGPEVGFWEIKKDKRTSILRYATSRIGGRWPTLRDLSEFDERMAEITGIIRQIPRTLGVSQY